MEITTDLQGMFQALGVCGVLVYIGAFAALQLKMIDGNSLTYTAMNLAAASLVLISLIYDFNLASALIQISWIIIGLVGLLVRLRSS